MREMNRRELMLGALALGACNKRQKRPNILFVMSDDHAAGHTGCYGNEWVKTPFMDLLADQGTRFATACVTNSLCAPGRAAVLTGTFSHINGILGNSEAKDSSETLNPAIPTFPEVLQKAGYRTGIVGKWHLPQDPKGFDHWCVLPGQGVYFNPEFIENGKKRKFVGYATDITTDLALQFVNQSFDRPWCLLYQHKAPHRPFLPPVRFSKMYEDIDLPLPETFEDDYATRRIAKEAKDMRIDVSLAGDYKDLPGDLKGARKKEWIYQRFVKDYYGSITAVDENLGRLISAADEDTLIIYTSDNGFFVGDHGWYDKRFMYEPSLKVPLIVRAPGGVKGQISEEMVQNIDIAPTILDYASVSMPETMQGRSLRPILEGKKPSGWRKSIYYAYYENSWALAGKGKEAMADPSFQYFTPHRVGPHRGVRTKTHKLIQYYSDGDYWELFNLRDDPYELENLYGRSGQEAITAELKKELTRLRELYRDV